jgi:peptidoglycan LD-endopeptidase CwlK
MSNYTPDARSQSNIDTLTPATQAKAVQFLSLANDGRLGSGVVVKIISGTRTYDEQSALYAQGRTTPGPIVTNAPAGYSNHNFSIAFDIGIFQDGDYLDDSPLYRQLGAIGKSIGLTWGGDWANIDDEPHFELSPWPGLSEDDLLAKLRACKADGEAIA